MCVDSWSSSGAGAWGEACHLRASWTVCYTPVLSAAPGLTPRTLENYGDWPARPADPSQVLDPLSALPLGSVLPLLAFPRGDSLWLHLWATSIAPSVPATGAGAWLAQKPLFCPTFY